MISKYLNIIHKFACISTIIINLMMSNIDKNSNLSIKKDGKYKKSFKAYTLCPLMIINELQTIYLDAFRYFYLNSIMLQTKPQQFSYLLIQTIYFL